MKKIFLASLVAVFGFANQITAQSSITATLIHEDDIKTFYGKSALKEAHSAAVHGDIITLSSGRFTSTNIYKAVAVRGAGMEYDSLSATEPTIISGNFEISISNDSTLQNNVFSMEAIYHNDQISVCNGVQNPQFIKCKFGTITTRSSNYAGLINAQFIHCIISNSICIHNGSAIFYNCFVQYPYYMMRDSNGTYEFQNCVIRSTYIYSIYRSILRNSYLVAASSQGDYCILPSSAYAYNCVGNKTQIFNNQITRTNTYAECSSVFKTWTGDAISSFKSERLELTDEAKIKYLGGDGTQIGIYGGSIPFVARTSNPQITKLNVASKSTADGKLSIDIEVKPSE